MARFPCLSARRSRCRRCVRWSARWTSACLAAGPALLIGPVPELRETRSLLRTRAALLATACLLPAFVPGAAFPQALPHPHHRQAGGQAVPVPSGNTVQAIIGTGQPPDRDGDDRVLHAARRPGISSTRSLSTKASRRFIATGLFKNVTITRDGPNLVVDVSENPVIAQVAFEGNHEIVDKDLQSVVSPCAPTRSTRRKRRRRTGRRSSMPMRAKATIPPRSCRRSFCCRKTGST